MAQESALDFEIFSSAVEDIPYYDGFRTFFWRGALAELYRKSPSYIELQREAPDLERRLKDGISILPSVNAEALELFKHDLYEAILKSSSSKAFSLTHRLWHNTFVAISALLPTTV